MQTWFKQPFKDAKDRMFAVIGTAFFIGLVLLLLQGGDTKYFASPKPVVSANGVVQEPERQINRGLELSAQEKILEERVASALARMAGVGATEVRVSLAQGTVAEYAINTNAQSRKIEEKDKQGGTRLTADNTDSRQVVVIKEGGSAKEQPVVVREMRYQIAGVLVVAEGAKDPAVKENIARAVRTLLDIQPHKISIFPKEG
ncbi:MAG: hypothetical protein PHC60_02280 [Heliobacteriaceae bacterium]|nr:hypothetical protein [Heliobacteriaceae bacterium]MDD4587206.1 hypothetical protein [Heliobacteriaceae bacterium]